jgi:hypothetical protein
LCWRTHLDAASNPSLAVVDSASTAAPAMASTPPRRFSSSRLHLSCPSEPEGPREPHRGMCCLAGAELAAGELCSNRRSSGVLHRTPSDRIQNPVRFPSTHASPHVSLDTDDPPDLVWSANPSL